MKHALPLALLAAAGLASCLENEEVLTIAPDGSVEVELTAHGDAADLLRGHPVPFGGPWVPADAATATWAEAARAAGVDGLSELPIAPDENGKAGLSVRAHFPSIDDLPADFVPTGTPYAEAFLQRSTKLEVERKGDRTVYVFERTFPRRDLILGDFHARMRGWRTEIDELALGDEPEDWDAAEWDAVHDVLQRMVAGGAEVAVREALSAVYTIGDASLSTAAARRVIDGVRSDCEELVSPERVRGAILNSEEEGGDVFEDELAELVRASTEARLEREGVPSKTRNAIVARLELLRAHADHSDDLRDEGFHLTVHLPGTVVGGNFAESSGGTAKWSFEGDRLVEGDVVLRAVSVVD